METTKMIQATKKLDKLMKILQGFLKAGVIVSAVFLVMLFVAGEKILADTGSLELGSLTLQLTEAALPEFSRIRPAIAIVLIASAVSCGAGWYMTAVIRQILEPMTQGRPFEAGISGKIRTLAWVSLAAGAAVEICKAAETYAEMTAYNVEQLFNPALVESGRFDYNINFSFAVLTVVLLVLAHIFRYGESLQREADETL